MKKTHRGSCHCGAVRFECQLDLTGNTMRCNCGFCRKARFWFAIVPAPEFQLLQGQDALTDYQFTPTSKPEPFLHLSFCKHCGVRPFSAGGAHPQLGGPFFAVNVVCLDDATDEELAAAPIHFADGRNDNWSERPAEVRYM